MEMFITKDELALQLNLLLAAEDASYLDGLIAAASDVINDYVQGNTKDDDGEIYPRIKQATKMLAAEWFLNREANNEGRNQGNAGLGFLPQPIQSILYPLRRPVIL